MKQPSPDRILTTHVGSLPRPKDLLDMMKAKLSGQSYDHRAYEARVKSAVAEIVKKQVDTGIDIVADGEQSKPGFFTYVRERLEGFEPRPGRKANFKSVRGDFKYNNNHHPIQDFYLLKAVKGGPEGVELKIEKKVFENHKDAYHQDCKMKW